ncbi:MAG: methylated-DNA--[protein]-cysteine S-methyltransferase [Bacteroidetes bacterium]|nr:methylated-DNA--[protein]-cysteine S-methyltransferase [Bacteroidota bacterium]
MTDPGMQHITYLKSPIGNLKICGNGNGISSVDFTDQFEETTSTEDLLLDCAFQLDQYFKGKQKDFSVPLDLKGTVFQKKIWSELQKIPFGKTISYLELAMRHGDVKAIRAVGLANAKNPVAILVPCHRVIGVGGDLTGYAGGLQRKKWLLELEGSLHPDLFSARTAL